jgi:hypothetical protein
MRETKTTHTTPTRRSAIGFSLAAFAAGLTVPVLASATEPDAELIRLCADFRRRWRDYNTINTDLDSDEDPRWPLLLAAEDRARDTEAQTVAGLIAKAEVALLLASQPDGSEKFGDGFNVDWLEQIVRDLLSLQGGAAA